MFEVDLTVTISVILGVSAVLAPIATAIINNRYQLKLKKIDLDWQHFEKTVIYKKSIFENYLKYAGRCIGYSDGSALKEYNEYYFLALLYAPSSLHQEMIETHQFMSNLEWGSASASFESLTPQIHTFLQTL